MRLGIGMNMIEVRDLKKVFKLEKSEFKKSSYNVKAVDGINFAIEENKTLGLVGESGSGKSTTGRLILRLINPTSGKIYLNGRDISKIKYKEFNKLRKDLQMVFQNPYSSLDNKMSIYDSLIQPLKIHNIVSPLDYKKEVEKLLDMVKISKESLYKFPHEFSGGQRQRISIARALSTRPKFLVFDEPVSALDVSIQAQVLNLISDLKEEFNLTYLFIAHDLNVIRHVSDTIAVMYMGKILEKGNGEQIFNSPKHPYTKLLLSSIPGIDRSETLETGAKTIFLDENKKEEKLGCPFYSRCESRMDKCKRSMPEVRFIEGVEVFCFLYDKDSDKDSDKDFKEKETENKESDNSLDSKNNLNKKQNLNDQDNGKANINKKIIEGES